MSACLLSAASRKDRLPLNVRRARLPSAVDTGLIVCVDGAGCTGRLADAVCALASHRGDFVAYLRRCAEQMGV